MPMDFAGKTVLVTGGVGGIGKAIADYLYELGATLILTGIPQEHVERLNAEHPDRRTYFEVDFTAPASMERFTEQLKTYDRIDACVNNAGINIVHDYCDVPQQEFDKVFQVNTLAPYKILKAVIPTMMKNGYGRVVNIASIWSLINRPGRSSYSISKNAVHGLTKSLAVEFASQNILINSVSPGFTLTELTARTNTPEQITELSNKVPAHRMAQPIEIARVVVFLISEENSYLTGQNIAVDGGYSII